MPHLQYAMTTKTTAFHQIHIDAGAKMVPFAGYDMPVNYTSITEEHLGVRNQAGLFDVSHMGQFIVKGKQAIDLVQKVSSNDASTLSPGQAQYSCLPNADGGVVDDLIVYRLYEDMCSEGEQAYMLVVNASNIDKDWAWIEKANTFDTKMINISDQTSLLALQGPKAIEILKTLTDVAVADIPYYEFNKGQVGGIDNVLISATGYTGSGGVELYFDQAHSQAMWNAIIEAGKPHGLVLAGLGCRDTLRLEKGYALYGHELDDETSPIAARLGWIVKSDKSDDFFSKDTFAAEKTDGTAAKLIGFKMDDRRIPRQGYEVCDMNEEVIGRVTSGTMSPSLDQAIGIGYAKRGFTKVGSSILIKIRKKFYPAKIVKLPFV